MIRAIIERLARERSFWRRLPAEFGKRPICVSPDAALAYLRVGWGRSEGLLDAVRKYVREGDHVWDVGGNVGVFTIAAAHLAGSNGQIVTIEADPFLASLLQRSTLHANNSDRKINILCAAASDAVGLARFMVASRGRSSSSLERSGHRSQAGGIRYYQYVPTMTLDSLLGQFAPPQVVKIDVEGAEAFVLAGAERMLSEARPRLYIEVGKEQSNTVASVLKSHGYRLYDGDADDGIELAHCAYNTFAVPTEQDMTNRSA